MSSGISALFKHMLKKTLSLQKSFDEFKKKNHECIKSPDFKMSNYGSSCSAFSLLITGKLFN